MAAQTLKNTNRINTLNTWCGGRSVRRSARKQRRADPFTRGQTGTRQRALTAAFGKDVRD
jgi:hypothetical protein